MFSRRRKLLRSNIKKELLDEGNARAAENVTEIDNWVNDREEKKMFMLKNFKIGYLEEMLNSSTKSVAWEVVSTLVSETQPGTLSILEKKMGEEYDN